MPRKRAFTLVELLVVIGIIGLLIAILLPALAAVRRQAAALKCASNLRELYKCSLMYVQDNRGYLPPGRCGSKYNLDGIIYNGSNSGTDVPGVSVAGWAYWYHFLSRYSTKVNSAASTAADSQAGLATILWGCPAFAPYTVGDETENMAGGFNRVYRGYGWNGHAYITSATDPAVIKPFRSDPAASDITSPDNWGTITGRWYKYTNYNRSPAQRCLIADCFDWAVYSGAAPTTGIPGLKVYGWPAGTLSAPGSTLYDFYRHGRTPGIAVSPDPANKIVGQYAASGGKPAYNILYCDGHVSLSTDLPDAYRSFRMRYPG